MLRHSEKNIIPERYSIGDFEDFPFAQPRPGWLVRNGAWLNRADVDYKKIWAYLRETEEGRSRCVTSAVYDSMSAAAGGVGGVMWFVVDEAGKRIKLPDNRGDYSRCAGSSYLQAVGAWHSDALRNAMGGIVSEVLFASNASGVFRGKNTISRDWGGHSYPCGDVYMDLSLSLPTASEIRTRTYGALGCVYTGVPT